MGPVQVVSMPATNIAPTRIKAIGPAAVSNMAIRRSLRANNPGTQRAVRRFGSQIVRRMSLAGEVFVAAEAERFGLVDKVVAKGAGLAAAQEMANKIASRGPKATALSKLLINMAEGEEREAAIEAIAGEIAAGSAELKEGIAAFRAKRKPSF
jgi:enoyl-CoA hydratase/carnithine racemase